MTKNIQLKAPENYYNLSEDEKQEITNKCGPNGFLSKIIPNSLLGVDISESCNIHDYMFHHSKDKNDQKIADKVFLKNLNSQIRNKSKGFTSTFRRGMAYLYYYAVRLYSIFRKSQIHG